MVSAGQLQICHRSLILFVTHLIRLNGHWGAKNHHSERLSLLGNNHPSSLPGAEDIGHMVGLVCHVGCV